MEYKMGVIGIGHWFKRLQGGLDAVGGIKVTKALGTKPYAAKADSLRELGITPESYYTIGADGTIPEGFFEDIEIVHLSNPPDFHASQEVQSLSKGKRTIVEKSYGVNKKEFDSFRKFVKEGGYTNSIYLHLHYLHKMPSLILRRSIKELSAKHGKIISITGTFFEQADEEDTRRAAWLLDMKSGGLFMDWVHPFEVAYYATGVYFGKISKISLYTINQSYSGTNPSGIMVELGLKGKRAADGAVMTVNIAKGVDPKYAKKSMLFKFEDGSYARLGFLRSDAESRENRGVFETGRISDGSRTAESVSTTTGRASSEFFVKDIIKLSNGKKAGLSMSQVAKVFRPQWEYQKLAPKQQLIRDKTEIESFLQKGLSDS
jgi:predicted dehydrogenase